MVEAGNVEPQREVIGIYLSSHPLDDFSVIIRHYCSCSLGDLSDLSSMNGRDFMVAGMVTSVMHLTTKTGKPYGRFTIEDYNGSHEFVLFSKEYENFRRYMFEGYYLFIRGRWVLASTIRVSSKRKSRR